jgi:hypothetical protein
MKIYKTIELSKKSDLPENGWIQACLACDGKTARLYDYKVVETPTKIYDIKAHLCPDCKKKLINNDFVKKLHKKCNKYIDRLYPNLSLITNELYLPVEPNPPAPREVLSSSSTISI